MLYGVCFCGAAWALVNLYILITTGMFDQKKIGWTFCHDYPGACAGTVVWLTGAVVGSTGLVVLATWLLRGNGSRDTLKD
jgi:hypothetical protein